MQIVKFAALFPEFFGLSTMWSSILNTKIKLVSSTSQRKIHLFCFQEWERVYFYRQNPENLPVYSTTLSLQINFSSF